MTMIEQMVEQRVGIAMADIDGFIAAKGPGSFTGLRIGISVVKGLAAALSKPEAGASSLDGIGWRFQYSSLPVCAMMDARRGEVYCAIYRFDKGRCVSKTPEKVMLPEDAVDAVGQNVLFAGSGAQAYKELIKDKTKAQAIFTHGFENHVSASALIRALIDKKDFFNLPENSLIPAYIRKSDAELQLAKKQQS